MRVSALLAVLPLAIAAPATDTKRFIPELDVSEWNDIQSTFVDRVWNGLSGWSWNKAEEIIGVSKDDGKTIYQQLKEDEQFSKLVKAIEFSNVKDKFDDPKLHFTFFAPNNDALKPPPGFPHHHHDHHDHHHHHDSLLAELEKSPSLATVTTLLDSDVSLLDKDGDDDDEEKKRRKEIFRKIVTKILGYHVVKTAPYTAAELAQNSTVATALKAEDGSFAGLHRRIKVDKVLVYVPPALVINSYAKVISADNKASNGIYHVINHPLIPPPSLFDELYIATDFFSTLTQATYGLHGQEYTDYHYDRDASKPGHPKFKGTPLATLFAPTNGAFHALPGPLKFFLFSPFGEHALAKTLAYHYIPDTLLLSELLVDQRKHKHLDGEAEVEYFALGDDPSFHKEFDIHPKLPNSTLHIVVDKTKILPIEGAVRTTIKVNNQIALSVDLQARNGAFHPLGKLLVPPHHHHDEHGVDIAHLDTWENWEEWIPAFAAEPLAL